MSRNNIIEKFKRYDIIKTGEFTLKSGAKSNIYFDLRSICSYPDLLSDVSLELSKLIPDRDIVIAGVPMGAIVYACQISQILNIPMILIRESRKDHGMQKIIEGNSFSREVVLVEDVVTSGESVLNAINIIESEGVKVRKVIVILDRKSGGVEKIRQKGYNIESLFTIDDVLNHVVDNKLVIKNGITERLTDIINKKKTNLIVSLDITSISNILRIVSTIGDYICAIKMHFDIFDLSSSDLIEFGFTLKHLAENKNFLVIEDRKYADIPFISVKQYKIIKPYVDIVTMHGVCGIELVNEFDKLDVGVLLVHKLSVKDNLIDNNYSNKVKNVGLECKNIVGFVSQEGVIPGYLTFTPGINLSVKTDGMGQTYRTIGETNSDVFIVGRGIYESENVLETTKIYQELCFKKWRY